MQAGADEHLHAELVEVEVLVQTPDVQSLVPSVLLKQPDPLRTLKPPFLKVEHWSGVEELVNVFGVYRYLIMIMSFLIMTMSCLWPYTSRFCNQ